MSDPQYHPSIVPADGGPSRAAPPPPPPTRLRKSGSGLKILAVISFVLLGLSMLANVLLLVIVGAAFAMGANGDNSKVDEDIIRQGENDKIVILPIDGTIDGAMSERVRLFCDKIQNDDTVKAVVVEVDSPGGGITASDEIYNRLLTLKTNGKFKLYVSMQSLTASGGYYASMAGDKLFAERTSLVGSIGVIWPAFEASRLLDKIGITPEIIKSDQANEFKDAGSPFKKFTDEDRAYIRNLLNDAHARFREVVETGRPALKPKMDDIAIGKIWSADDALKLGLVDEIGYLDDACAAIARDSGITKPTIVRLKEHRGFFDALGASSSLGSPKVSIELNPKLLEDIQTPRMEYRWIP